MFDAALCLGICDKIVPGLLMGALAFGHLPTIFVPGGPMPSGVPNKEKARIRQLFAEGKVGRDALLESEAQSYHSQGTCTFYGTANSNQMLMEVMGLHLPGAAFVPPNTPLRDALTSAAARRAARITALGDEYLPIAGRRRRARHRECDRRRCSRRAARPITRCTWSRSRAPRACASTGTTSADLSEVVPLLARIYPNGSADVNHFHAAGGSGFLIRELLSSGLLHADTTTVMGNGLAAYTHEPWLSESGLALARMRRRRAAIPTCCVRCSDPFGADGGLKVLRGNLGRAVIKTSAVQPQHRVVEAPAAVFDDQEDVIAAFKAGALTRDCIVVVRFQGPRANGMPELHQLTPALSSLQEQGLQGRAGHRRPHVRRIGRSARGHSHHARMPRRRPARQGAGWRHRAARQLRRHARSARAGRDAAQPARAAAGPRRTTRTASGASCSRRSAAWPAMPKPARFLCSEKA